MGVSRNLIAVEHDEQDNMLFSIQNNRRIISPVVATASTATRKALLLLLRPSAWSPVTQTWPMSITLFRGCSKTR
jgi:hypothetical protein